MGGHLHTSSRLPPARLSLARLGPARRLSERLRFHEVGEEAEKKAMLYTVSLTVGRPKASTWKDISGEDEGGRVFTGGNSKL